MTHQRIAQTNQQQKSEAPHANGILQRTIVRYVPETGVQPTEDTEQLAFSNSPLPQDFSRVPVSTTNPPQIMAKLMIGAVGDKYEQEADRVASEIVSRINTPVSQTLGQGEAVQGEMQTKDDKTKLMRRPLVQRLSGDGGMAAPPELEASIRQASGSGQPLADNIRKPIEQAFGTDFSSIKVHTDATSHHLNQSIQAKAFTTGQNIFFRQGMYNPRSREGMELIAHELVHVEQQKQGSQRVQRMFQAFNRLIGKRKILQLGNKKIGLEQEGGYYRFDKTVAKEAYIPISNLDEQGRIINDNELEAKIEEYLQGNLVLYRGITNWHKTWAAVRNHRRVEPLGTGDMPDFETNKTKFIPFSPDLTTARSSARQISGMGAGDEMRFVMGYKKTEDYEVGMVLMVIADINTPVAFYSSSEIQVAGPIEEVMIKEVHTGATPLTSLGIEGGGILKDILPDEPKEEEKNEYRRKYTKLRHEVTT